MKKESINKAKLGAFVLIGTTCLILGLYFIGSKKNIFHSTIDVSANFNNVGGLMEGNNVRFNGINVGTVSKVTAIADTLIKVDFTIDEESTKYINKYVVASIGTDGLLGNKLVNIAPGKKGNQPLKEGFVLHSINPVQMESGFRTLSASNENIKTITNDIKGITGKINSNNSILNLLTDKTLSDNIRNSAVNFKLANNNTAIITGNLSKIVQDIKSGRGTVGTLLTDTLFSGKLNQTIVNIQAISDSVAIISGNFKTISKKLENGSIAIGTLLTDTSFIQNVNKSMENIKQGSRGFSENMEALKHSFIFKKYFKRLKKGPKSLE